MPYEDRKQPSEFFCPECLGRGRQSVAMKQFFGGKDFRWTCADSSICSWGVMGDENGWRKVSFFQRLGIFRGQDTDDK